MYGFILIFIGVLLHTIAGFIRMARYPKLTNIENRIHIDPKRPSPSEYPTEDEFIYSWYQDPKIMWWNWSGFASFATGLFLVLIGV
jgi:hypothetical protein